MLDFFVAMAQSADWFSMQCQAQLESADSVHCPSEQKQTISMNFHAKQPACEHEQHPPLVSCSESSDDEEDCEGEGEITLPELSKSEKDYDRKVATKLTQDINVRLSQGVYGTDPARAAHVCELIRTQLAPALPGGPVPDSKKAQTVIIQRLRDAIVRLSSPTQFNSTQGRERRHFLAQLLADEQLGDGDPALQLIYRELQITNKQFYRQCAKDIKEHGFDYVPPARTRTTVLQHHLKVTYHYSVDMKPCDTLHGTWYDRCRYTI